MYTVVFLSERLQSTKVDSGFFTIALIMIMLVCVIIGKNAAGYLLSVGRPLMTSITIKARKMASDAIVVFTEIGVDLIAAEMSR
jgi:hypothetical protein